MSIQIAKRPFNVDEYHRMAETGILSERDRVELIEGEIIEMNPIGSRHFSAVIRLTSLLTEQLGKRVHVSIQGPVRIDDFSEPEPDVVLLKPRDDFYAGGLPQPKDVLLLIEVSDTSLAYDRQVKLPLYAKAEIAEVWIVDLAGKCIETYSQPVAGKFERFGRCGAGEQIQSALIPDLVLAASDILG